MIVNYDQNYQENYEKAMVTAVFTWVVLFAYIVQTLNSISISTDICSHLSPKLR